MTGERSRGGFVTFLTGLLGLVTAVVILATSLQGKSSGEDGGNDLPSFVPGPTGTVSPARSPTVATRICNTLTTGAHSEIVVVTLGIGGTRNELLVNTLRPTRCIVWRSIKPGTYRYTLFVKVDSGVGTESFEGTGTIRVFDGARYLVVSDDVTAALQLG
ncbi:hypothetical protein [Nonomuraea sp. NPDC049141]|uniref:hypothetical protein n=1 Tax=Nonomuraea sp. NPDC049141 TaxID=3155500 RepID=UPI0033E6E963